MKKVISLLLCICVLFSLFGCKSKTNVEDIENTKTEPKVNYSDNLKAVWLSFYEIGDIFKDLDEAAAKEKLNAMFTDLADRGINTVFFHVRAFCDAFYQSDYFPVSAYCASDYDLFKHAVFYAHKQKLSIQAWVNPYRVALDTTIDRLPGDSPAVKLYKEDKSHLILVGGNIFLNPASAKAQKLILNGIREIVSKYDVDGIHFDDYFYPSAEKGIDKVSYAAYREVGSRLKLEDYRRENVTALIAATHLIVKQHNSNMLFGVSPQCFIEKNKTELFADIEKWIENDMVDYIMPQIYFGFENESAPFRSCVDTWCELMQGKQPALYIGLALYKSGKEDEYASDNTKSTDSPYYEWQNHSDIIARQIEYTLSKGIKGYSLYSFSSLTADSTDNENLLNEVQNIQKLLKQ